MTLKARPDMGISTEAAGPGVRQTGISLLDTSVDARSSNALGFFGCHAAAVPHRSARSSMVISHRRHNPPCNLLRDNKGPDRTFRFSLSTECLKLSKICLPTVSGAACQRDVEGRLFFRNGGYPTKLERKR